MKKNGIAKILVVVLGVSLVCSFMVSTAAVKLQDRQNENRRLDRIKNILIAADLYRDEMDVDATYRQRIEPLVIDLDDGRPVAPEQLPEGLNAEGFDIQSAARDRELGVAIATDEDLANIKRRPRYMVIYLAKKDQRADKIILPVYGRALWSTLYGFLTLDRDLQTITGITFYEHGETPGLGGEVDNPRWQKSWHGKKAFDHQGDVAIEVIKGTVDANAPKAQHQVDGLAGATLTTRGVNNLVRYWLGPDGYGPFLQRGEIDG